MNHNPQKTKRPDDGSPLRVAIVGFGGIASIVIKSLENGDFPNFNLVGVLARTAGKREGFETPVYSDLNSLLALSPDLIIEMAGPPAFTELAVDLIAAADVWSISGKILADEALSQKIEAAGLRTGHSLRLLPGALTGFDAVALAAADQDGSAHIRYSNSDQDPEDAPKLVGSAREIVTECGGVNVVAAVAVAGFGMDDTTVEYFQPKPGSTPVFTIKTSSAHAHYTIHGGILPGKKIATAAVASSVFAALRQASATIWVG